MRYEQWFQLCDEIARDIVNDFERLRKLGLEISDKQDKGEDVSQDWITWKEQLGSFMVPALKRRLSIRAQELDRLSMLNVEFNED